MDFLPSFFARMLLRANQHQNNNKQQNNYLDCNQKTLIRDYLRKVLTNNRCFICQMSTNSSANDTINKSINHTLEATESSQEKQSQINNICDDCLQHLPSFNVDNSQHCDICSASLKSSQSSIIKKTDAKTRCSNCIKSSPYISKCYGFYRYQFPLNYWLQQYKFHHQYHYVRLFGELFAHHYQRLEQQNHPDKNKIDAIIPVPSHPLRQVEHGFDHTKLLAKELSKRLSIPYHNALIRRNNPKPLSSLTALSRKQYIKNSYFYQSEKVFKKVALIDDIVTSGSTLKEAAKTLFNAGVKDIEIWTIAKVLKD